ncbi:MAG: class I SAM-dependent methyltransferase [Luteolibacter sp.]
MKITDSDPMFPPRPTALAQQILREILREGDLVIDATAGNGHDTLFLAACVGLSGRVLAFDVQAAAIASARAKIEQAGFAGRVGFFEESHELMEAHAAVESVAAVMFNLGYLPGDDHELTTETATTLAALEAAARLLKPGGALSVICYPGHPSGMFEAGAVESWMASQTAKGWRIAKYGAIATRRPAPFLLLAQPS